MKLQVINNPIGVIDITYSRDFLATRSLNGCAENHGVRCRRCNCSVTVDNQVNVDVPIKPWVHWKYFVRIQKVMSWTRQEF